MSTHIMHCAILSPYVVRLSLCPFLTLPYVAIQGAAEKSSPLKFFAVFSATV